MEFDPLFGRRLTALTVLETWRYSSDPEFQLPLFGAVALEFGALALLLKSPLRFARIDRHASLASFLAPDGLRANRASYRPIVCELDALEFHKRALQGVTSAAQPCRWISVLPQSRTSLVLDNLPDLQQLYDQTLLGMTAVSSTVIELRFTGQEFPTRTHYREDLDGAIQVAWAGWQHRIREIVVSEPECAFGWLHLQAPYPICARSRRWPNIERYIKWATWDATRGHRDPLADDRVLLAIHEDALRMKFECHPALARRFAAIRYPIAGLSDMAIQGLTRLRAARSLIPPS